MPRQFEKSVATGEPFRIGEWLVEPSLNRVTKGDTTIQLELKVMDVLVCLVGRAEEVVTRQEIIDRVWATEFIADNTLTHCITEIRNALGDDARNPSYIETIHRRGYRLIAEVKPAGSDDLGRSRVARFPVPERQDERSPYPGLAAFTEADAEFFFGREDEVAQMWRKLTSRRLLAVIGPSGVGKSSFLRAGVIPTKPEGWNVILCEPGEAPFASLARALVPEFAGDMEAVARLVDIHDGDRAVAMVSRWRDRYRQALLIVDQFEELFTLNPVENQGKFAALLRRLVDDADVHVLLSMRDDFLYRCQSLESLHAVLDGLFALEQPSSESLTWALVEPARRLGYAFEDDELPGEMVAEVEGERGALPMLAFAVARLWDLRDSERRLLTRQIYDDIGGVGGALARHAESTLKSLGDDRTPIAREIFRNLVTSQGTRAVREWDEVLSIFTDSRPDIADEVLRALIDARLLTSYEVRADDGAPARRVELVHESLLTSWPRLVRWQTQDADAAHLRDELRQAARTWDERHRAPDYLWTGKQYRECAVWHENYPGGLMPLESDFVAAMIALSKRRKRRRRLGITVAFVAMIAVLITVWVSRQQAVAEAHRAEAAKLLALGELEFDTYPTAALAWAVRSLELSDSLEGRLLALRALQSGPTEFELEGSYANGAGFYDLAISPSGEWIATGEKQAQLWYHDGRPPIAVGVHQRTDGHLRLMFEGDEFLVTGLNGVHRWWAVPDVREPVRVEEGRAWLGEARGNSYFSFSSRDGLRWIHRWSLDGGSSDLMRGMDPWDWLTIDASGSRVAYSRGGDVYLRSLDDWDRPPKLLGVHPEPAVRLAIDPSGDRVAAYDGSGEIRIWPTNGSTSDEFETLEFEGLLYALKFSPSGRWLAGHGKVEDSGGVWLWDLDAPRGVEPLALKRSGDYLANDLEFHPSGEWLITANYLNAGFWPLGHAYPRVFDLGGRVFAAAFTPDGRWLITVTSEGPGLSPGQVRAWPIAGQNGGAHRVLLERRPLAFYGANVAVDSAGKNVVVGTQDREVIVLSIEGGEPRILTHTTGGHQRVAFSPDGRMVAAVPNFAAPGEMLVRVWDLESGEMRVVGEVDGESAYLGFIDEKKLLWAGHGLRYEGGGERVFDLRDSTVEVTKRESNELARFYSNNGRFILRAVLDEVFHRWEGHLAISDLESGQDWRLNSHGTPGTAAFHPSDNWVVSGGKYDGAVRIGPVTGEEPHLLLGHSGWVRAVVVSPDGRWIASFGEDFAMRLWPMPDLSKPPLHTLPHDELIAKLKSLTNLRVVRDEESSTGWKVEVGPFPGWETVPEW